MKKLLLLVILFLSTSFILSAGEWKILKTGKNKVFLMLVSEDKGENGENAVLFIFSKKEDITIWIDFKNDYEFAEKHEFYYIFGDDDAKSSINSTIGEDESSTSIWNWVNDEHTLSDLNRLKLEIILINFQLDKSLTVSIKDENEERIFFLFQGEKFIEFLEKNSDELKGTLLFEYVKDVFFIK